MIVAGICRKHGYWKGEDCSLCIETKNESFYTSKDKLWEFIDTNTTGKPVEIRTKRQWYKHLKRNNLHDDLPKWDKIPEHKFEKPDRHEIEKLVGTALREKHKWVPKEEFYRRRP